MPIKKIRNDERKKSLIYKVSEFPVLAVIGTFMILMLILERGGVSITFGIEILIFALAAWGVAFLFGYIDLLSFGHAAFFGVSAYVMTYLISVRDVHISLAILISVIAVLLLALLISYLSVRSHGLYFAIITLAFAEIIYFAVFQFSDITGGDSGLVGLTIRPDINLGVFSIDLNSSLNFFLVTGVITIIFVYAIKKLLGSQLGAALIAIGQNEERAKAVGYNTDKLKIIAFTFSGMITGVAGILYTIYLGSVTPAFLHWSISGDFILITILGGFSSFFGPIIGAVFYIGLREVFSAFTDRHFLFVAIVFILIIYYAPRGPIPILKRINREISDKGVAATLNNYYDNINNTIINIIQKL